MKTLRGPCGSSGLVYDPLPVRNATKTHQRSYVIAFNPSSGKGLGAQRASALRDLLVDSGADVSLCETRADQNVFAESGLGEGAEAVLVLGGDGTLHEAANGLVGQSVPVLFCGTGTVNVFGLEFGLDSTPAGCEAMLRSGQRASMPLLQASSSRRFVMFAEMGFLGRAVARVNERRKRSGRHGKIEFVTAFLAECFSSWGRSVRVRCESDERPHGPYSNVLLTRARRYADQGRIPIGKEIEAPLLEEAFEVVGYRSRTPLGHLIATGIVAGGLLPRLLPICRRLGLIDVFRTNQLRVLADREQTCHVDAETLLTRELDVRANGSLTVIIPR